MDARRLYFATQAYLNPAFQMRPPWRDVLAVNLTAMSRRFRSRVRAATGLDI